MFTLIGARPASRAAAMPSRTRATGKSTPFMRRKTSSSSESRLTVIRRRPASASGPASLRSADPFVVRVRSRTPSIAASWRTRSGRSLPDGRLAAGDPELLDAQPDEDARQPRRSPRRSGSASGAGMRSRDRTPRRGMQYVQRKLQRSVTEMRRSCMRRPRRSIGTDASRAEVGSGLRHGRHIVDATPRGRAASAPGDARRSAPGDARRSAPGAIRRCSRPLANGGDARHRAGAAGHRRDPAGTTGGARWYHQSTPPHRSYLLASAAGVMDARTRTRSRGLSSMATTDSRTGFRLPWSTDRAASREASADLSMSSPRPRRRSTATALRSPRPARARPATRTRPGTASGRRRRNS